LKLPPVLKNIHPRWKTVSRTLTVFPDPDGLAALVKSDQPHTDFSLDIGAVCIFSCGGEKR
jgi:hypothetical protein